MKTRKAFTTNQSLFAIVVAVVIGWVLLSIFTWTRTTDATKTDPRLDRPSINHGIVFCDTEGVPITSIQITMDSTILKKEFIQLQKEALKTQGKLDEGYECYLKNKIYVDSVSPGRHTYWMHQKTTEQLAKKAAKNQEQYDEWMKDIEIGADKIEYGSVGETTSIYIHINGIVEGKGPCIYGTAGPITREAFDMIRATMEDRGWEFIQKDTGMDDLEIIVGTPGTPTK